MIQVMALMRCGFLKAQLGQLEQAETDYVAAHEMMQRLGYGDHEAVAKNLANRAHAISYLHRADESIQIFEEALAMQRRLYAGDHPDIANCLSSLASIYLVIDQPHKARPIIEEAHAMAARVYPEDHPHRGTIEGWYQTICENTP